MLDGIGVHTWTAVNTVSRVNVMKSHVCSFMCLAIGELMSFHSKIILSHDARVRW